MKNLNSKDKYLLIFLGIVVIIFAYYKYFLTPVMGNITSSKEDIDRYNSDLNQLKIVGIANDKLEEKLAKVKLSYNDAILKLPVLEKNPEIAYNIKPLADANRVNLASVSLSEGTQYTTPVSTSQKSNVQIDSANLYTASVNLIVSANNYSNMMDFVNALETDKRINEITSISMQYQKSPNIDTSRQTASTGGTTKTLTTIDENVINASISINYFYNLNGNEKPKYDFNKGTYGKDDLFR